MSVEEIHVPDLGGSDEVEVIEVSVKAGDEVQQEDPIIVVESDKATVELPSPLAGRIQEIKISVGDRISEGDLVATIDTETAGDGKSDEADQDAADGESEGGESETDESQGEEPKSDEGDAETSTPAKETGEGDDQAGEREERVRVPDIGDADSIPVVEVNVAEGDQVEVDDPLVTVESDKATVEIPSPFAGRITRVLVSRDDQISEGDELVVIAVAGGSIEPAEKSADKSAENSAEKSESGEDRSRAPSAPASGEAESGRADRKQPSAPSPAPADQSDEPTSGKVHAGPAVRKLAREFGVDLAQVTGSGPKHRILKDDVQQFVKQSLSRQGAGAGDVGAGGVPTVKLPDFSRFGEVERKPMSRLQSATATNMHRSWLNVPHVTQFDEADITELEAMRKAKKGEGGKRGIKLTPLPFLLKACAFALRAMPAFNVSLDMDRRELIQKHYCHIGIAVDTPAGLMVPVIRDVDRKGIWELAEEAQELAGKARDKKLKPAEMQGGCFSITSLGGIGGTAFTPIVNTPEVAILGVSRASMKPVWSGEAFEPRLMLPLSLSYDHRAVNGADAARFTALLCRLLGDLRELLM